METNTALQELRESITGLSPEQGLFFLAELYPGQVTFSTSLGQEDQVISQIIGKHQLSIELFSLDTGRLFPETLDLLERTDSKYKIKTKVYYPDTQSTEELVNRIGINSFYASVENRKSCCFVRKVEPLKRALAGKRIWITGLRAEQSANRGAMQKIEWDEGLQIIKYNPLMDWTYAEMLAYIHENNIPYNPLHDRGFVSIGCAPCTRAIQAGEDPRAGRWWWEDSKKECGLHAK